MVSSYFCIGRPSFSATRMLVAQLVRRAAIQLGVFRHFAKRTQALGIKAYDLTTDTTPQGL